MDITGTFLPIFCSGYTYLELNTTLGAHLGIGCRPGMTSANAIGRFLGIYQGVGAEHLPTDIKW